MRDAFAAGQNVVFGDIRYDPRFSDDHRARNLKMELVGAVSVPMVKDGRVFALLSVHTKTPRMWTDDEIALVEETAQRTWEAVERARAGAALRESEQLARLLLEDATAARAAAEAANVAKDEFLAALGHELRTPLAAILLWARSLRSVTIPCPDASKAVDAIVHSAEAQSRLIEDLLDLSRLTSGRIRLQRSAFDVRTIVEDAVDTIRPMALTKRLTIYTQVSDGIGSASLDGCRFKEAVLNLLSNAVKFTPEGGTIKVSVTKDDDSFEIAVADDGEGIAAEFLPYVFDKFRQADMTETRRHVGLGIGLTLAKQLVELHGGTIEATSDGLGRGSTFRIRMPWIAAAAPSEPSGARMLPPPPILAGLRALVVEDDASTREAMTWSLERAGATVLPFEDAKHALAALDRGLHVDVIVSDLGLPGISGLELIAQIGHLCEQRGRRRPPSCAVSAHARDVDQQAAIAAGFDMYLAKPIPPELLIEAVADLGDVMELERRAVDLPPSRR
jgi:signal transduction histidine kinase/ActR/RegA family two-component response regulator